LIVTDEHHTTTKLFDALDQCLDTTRVH
jgi:TPR repeat protein